MSYELVHFDGMSVAGPSIRTDNQKASREIPLFWKKVFQEDILTKIPHAASGYVYGVYSDYESDQKGAYSLTGGIEVEETQELPEGIAVRIIPEGLYAVFTAHGPEELVNTWKAIWNSGLKRTYKFDFEEYGAEDQSVKIYVGVDGKDQPDIQCPESRCCC